MSDKDEDQKMDPSQSNKREGEQASQHSRDHAAAAKVKAHLRTVFEKILEQQRRNEGSC